MTISTIGYFGIKYAQSESKKGFLVVDTVEDSPAFKAGFKSGDIITAINAIPITSYEEMITMVQKYPPLTTIEVSFINSLSADQNEISIKKVLLAERPLNIDIPDNSQDMRYNLQFGEIVLIGTEAAKVFPEAAVGDNLIVHHSVEYKEMTGDDKNFNDWHLIEKDDNFEYRIVHAQKEVLGVWKVNEVIANSIIPFPSFIFCHEVYKPAEAQMINGIWRPQHWENSMEELTVKLEDLKSQIEELNTSTIMHQQDDEENYKQKGFIKLAIDSINKERRDITRKMHQKRLVDVTTVFINPKTNEEYLCDIQPGDKILVDYFTLYPLDIYGTHYVLVRPGHSEAYFKN